MLHTIVRSCEGELLAEASFLPAEASAGPVLRSRHAERLVDYFFARGGRDVVLDSGDEARRGRIVSTRWQPEGRLWFFAAA
jgi:hypothetical protein